jgi:broad specificity polyphosphatase/5'/3'-nucleotidase SurE
MIEKLDAAQIILIIGAMGAWTVTIIGTIATAVMAYQAKVQSVSTSMALSENTKLTTAAVESNGEIKALVNGTQTALLQKLSDAQAALNSTYAEIRSLRAINAAQQAHLAVASQPAGNGEQDKREAQQDRRDERQDQRDLRQVERSHNHILVGSDQGEPAQHDVLLGIETSTKQTAAATGKTADTLKEMQAETKPK